MNAHKITNGISDSGNASSFALNSDITTALSTYQPSLSSAAAPVSVNS